MDFGFWIVGILLCWSLSAVAAQPPAATLLFAPPGAGSVGMSAAGAEDIGSALWHNPAGLVHLRYREIEAGFGSNSNGFDAHAGYFDPGKPILGLPMAFRFDALTSNVLLSDTSPDRKFGDGHLIAVSAGAGFYAASRLSLGAATRFFHLKAPAGNGVGAVADLGAIYRPGELIRFSYGIKNLGFVSSIPGSQGDMPVTQLLGVHVKSPARGNIAMDAVLGWPADLKGFWSVAGTYRFTESLGMRFHLAEAKDIPVIDGRGIGFFLNTYWGKFDLSYQLAELGNFLRFTWIRRSSRPPETYPPLLRSRPRPPPAAGSIIYGEAEGEPAKEKTGSPAGSAPPAPPGRIKDAEGTPAVATPVDAEPPSTEEFFRPAPKRPSVPEGPAADADAPAAVAVPVDER
ncbi:MAG: hypothetical protein A3G34_06615 [Candidatus Lindowbacteria bacterium RIFCSPLOWO2_12_FULL_62_27]|nr:MAG: hypothetical protein A3G34_06615 [Candidatus Lindowbacteria bacterium RIFCSPLOWO2_12_FULL_62_27]OGH63057.1 MAG: hypothetical protein A3I06_16520 [Candidatus Lindowbacteria bacterium RIFCSPLOWO2_02_FULL_62_12]